MSATADVAGVVSLCMLVCLHGWMYICIYLYIFMYTYT